MTTYELAQKIAFQLITIHKESLSTAEKNIVKILFDMGIIHYNENMEVAWVEGYCSDYKLR